MKKNMKVFLKIVMLFVVFSLQYINVKAAPACCTANCKLGSCSINSTATSCACMCLPNGNPSCAGDKSKSISANPTQMGNIEAVILFYYSLESDAGDAAAMYMEEIQTLFIDNDGFLEEDSDAVEAYEIASNAISTIIAQDFSPTEQSELESLLDGMEEE